MALVIGNKDNQVTDSGTGGLATSTTPTSYTSLRRGSRGEAVTKLQNALAGLGYYTGAIDGSYGGMTESAVTKYQQAMGLQVDGRAGTQTQTSLYSKPVSPTTTTTVKSPAEALSGIKPSQTVPNAVTDSNTGGSPLVTPTQVSTFIKPSQVVPGAVTDAGTNKGGVPLVTPPPEIVKPNQLLPGATTDAGTNSGGTPLVSDYGRFEEFVKNYQGTPADAEIAWVKQYGAIPQPYTGQLLKSPTQQPPQPYTQPVDGKITPFSQPIMETDIGTNGEPLRGSNVIDSQIPPDLSPNKPGSGVGGSYTGGGSSSYTGGGSTQTGQLPSVDTGVDVTFPGQTGGGGTETGGEVTIPDYQPVTTPDGKTYKDIFAEVQTEQFVYDSAADEGYRIAASNVENEVAQMMVGRGGLYSSVATNAVQSRLMSLQIDYRKNAYEQFLTERNFKMQMAQFLAGRDDQEYARYMDAVKFQANRDDEAFNRSMQIAKYEADRSDEEFKRGMQIAEYNMRLQQQQFTQAIQKQNLALSQAQFSYRKQIDSLEREIAGQREALNTGVATYQNESSQFEAMKKKWASENGGYATAEVAAYFGIPQHTPYAKSVATLRMKQIEINNMKTNLVDFAKEINASDVIAGAANDWYEQSSQSYDVNKDSISVLGTSTQQSAFTSYLSEMSSRISQSMKFGLSEKEAVQAYYDGFARSYNAHVGNMGSLLAERMNNLIVKKLESTKDD